MEVVDNCIEEAGDWEDIVSFCADVSQALADAGEDNHDFEAWRPKQDERIQDVRQRTVDGESMDETRFEEASDGVRNDLDRVGGQVRDSSAELLDGHTRRSARKVGEAGETTATGLFAMLAKLVRGLESGIYRHVVEPANPDYFEGEHLSVALYRRGLVSRRYRCRIVVEQPDLQDTVVDTLTA